MKFAVLGRLVSGKLMAITDNNTNEISEFPDEANAEACIASFDRHDEDDKTDDWQLIKLEVFSDKTGTEACVTSVERSGEEERVRDWQIIELKI